MSLARRRRLWVATVALLLLPVGGAEVDAAPRVYVTKDCVDVGYKPSTIILACGDANAQLRGLDWSRWTAYKAIGQGRYTHNTCIPSCAEGTFRSRPVRVRLSRPRYCQNVGAEVFRRVRYSGDHQARRLFCPIG